MKGPKDRISFARTRDVLDRVFGDLVVDTLALRLPELLRIRDDHFHDSLDTIAKRQFFQATVRSVDVETHSYCNRACWFCPNAFVDRKSQTRYLSSTIYRQLLCDLAGVGYSGRFQLSHYNEPFAEDIIFEQIAQARRSLPQCTLVAFSNGDFLEPRSLGRIDAAGLSNLFLNCYLPNGTEWSDAVADDHILRVAKRLQLPLRRRRSTQGSQLSYTSQYNNVRIALRCADFRSMGIDRGGVIKDVLPARSPRRSPCLFPFSRITVDHRGQVMPCCNLRSDIVEHRPFTFGAIDDQPGSIFDVWGSEPAARWRRGVITYREKTGPCRGCLYQLWSGAGWLQHLHGSIMALRAPAFHATLSQTISTRPPAP